MLRSSISLLLTLCVSWSLYAQTGPVGWASLAGGTTGGAGGDTVTVTTRAQFLSYVGDNTARVIVIQDTLELNLYERVKVFGNKTIVGGTPNAMIRYGGLEIVGNNVIVQNLVIGDFYDGDWGGTTHSTDALTIYGQRVWIDHCWLYAGADGLLDVRAGNGNIADLITISYCRFSDHNKVTLIGASNDQVESRGHLRITFHHCWYDGTLAKGLNQRNPRVRFGDVHIFNTYYEEIDSYCAAARFESDLVLENNYFRNANNPHAIEDEGLGLEDPDLVAIDNIYEFSAGSQETGGTAFVPADFYSYVADPAVDVPALVMNGAGPFDPTDNQPPVAGEDPVGWDGLTNPIVIAATDNDTDADGGDLRIAQILNQPAGTAGIRLNQVYYTPPAGTGGRDTVLYLLVDTQGGVDTGRIIIELGDEPGAASAGKADVWDFGAAQLDTATYVNHLDATAINAWYDPAIPVGSTGNVLPDFSAGLLTWTGGGNDRLRSTNPNLTRYDENISSAPAEYTGRLYVNSAGNTSRYLSLTLAADDEVTLAVKTDSGGELNFQYTADPAAQTDQYAMGSAFEIVQFVAKEAGVYRFFATQGKPSYYRITRKGATYVELTGAVDTTEAAGLPSDYALVFTNAAGKAWRTTPVDAAYALELPAGYTYTLSLADANGFLISSGTSLTVSETTTTFDIAIQRVALYTVSGTITGLGDAIYNLTLSYTPDPAANTINEPMPVVDAAAGTYSVELEANVVYTISAEGVNDYFIPANTISIGAAPTTADIAFTARPVYPVAISTPTLTAEQRAALALTFENRNEPGYRYSFPSAEAVRLRDGVYTVTAGNLDAYPVQLALTSDLSVAGAATAKNLVFEPVTRWSFGDRVIANGDPAYKGMLFTGNVYNEIQKSHLAAGPQATLQVPVLPGRRVVVEYYYSADFSIEGGPAITTNSQSTNTIERATYDYPGTEPGYVTITVGAGAGTTYFTDVYVYQALPYTPTLRVGVDRDYQTINAALDAVRRMDREDSQRVTILVDPGNYEEMLVIDEPNLTLKNAAAAPNIDLLNQGVDIAPGAVRVTSYYGHGYDYFSMGDDQKWSAEELAVNTENGYPSTRNGESAGGYRSYWNATVVVTASGFVAEDIIFENSFNQYISPKEAADTVVEWPTGGKGPRPTDIGNVAVQDRSFVERAAAIAITNNTDKVILDKCRVVGRQDSFFGGHGARVVVYKGVMMGAVDYIFGGMTAVFYQSDLAMNTSDASNDRAYITAAQQRGERGFLMYACTVTSAEPGTETASSTRSKPGYFGRPWEAATSEAVFYHTTIETSDYPGDVGESLILPEGWRNTLGGESAGMYEYGTVEGSGVDNSTARAGWATLLTAPTLNDGTPITTFNFTKGNDGWDPLPALIEGDVVDVPFVRPETAVTVYGHGDSVYVANVTAATHVRVYGLSGVLVKTLRTRGDTRFTLPTGFWIIEIHAPDGTKIVKVTTSK